MYQQTCEACKGLAELLGKDVATSQDRPVRDNTCHVMNAYFVRLAKIVFVGTCLPRVAVCSTTG
jgi:hypothetical protein